MNELHFISFLIAFAVGFVAIKKFGISDKDMLDIFYCKNSEINPISESILITNESKEKTERFSKLEILLRILQELKHGVSNPIKISESIEIPLEYLMKGFGSLVNQGLIEPENVFLREPIEINTVFKITGKGKSVLKYFKDVETTIVEPIPPEVDNEIIL